MSNSKNNTIEIPVDIVEKIDFILNWVSSTITFWDLNKSWPCNLIQDSVDECIKYLKPYWQDPLE